MIRPKGKPIRTTGEFRCPYCGDAQRDLKYEPFYHEFVNLYICEGCRKIFRLRAKVTVTYTVWKFTERDRQEGW